MWEFSVDVCCPHCDADDQTKVASFNPDEFDVSGGLSRMMKDVCDECGKEFYFNADLRIEVEMNWSGKRKPKERSR